MAKLKRKLGGEFSGSRERGVGVGQKSHRRIGQNRAPKKAQNKD